MNSALLSIWQKYLYTILSIYHLNINYKGIFVNKGHIIKNHYSFLGMGKNPELGGTSPNEASFSMFDWIADRISR